MDLSKAEFEKLEQAKQAFKVYTLSRQQVEVILGRKLNDEAWKGYITSESRKHKNVKDTAYSVKRLFRDPPNKPKFSYSDTAKHAAQKARRLKPKQQDTDYRIAKLFKSNRNSYRIEKIKEYKYNKFNATRSDWKVFGDVDIFQIHNVLEELIHEMTVGLSDNVKLQIRLENNKNDNVNQTKLLDKADMILKLEDWVKLFIDYHDMEIEDITFKLLKIEIPTGSGKRVNKIITVDSKRSIIQIKNKDTICLSRAIVVGLAVHNIHKLQDILRNNIADDELKQINKTRQSKSQINDGIISDNEKTYLIDGRKLQDILAKILHRLCQIPIKETGNDLQDVKLFEERLDIEIQIYNLESRQIYRGIEKTVKIYILISENHYDVISNIAGFTCANESHHMSENQKCTACKSKNKCAYTESKVSCTECHKYFYGKECLENHLVNNKCTSHSYMCNKCHRFYKTRDLPMNEHKCDQLKCGNCKKYVNRDHQCYMLKKDVKPRSERYVFFDFETKLDLSFNKHIVNYCIAHYFNGEEHIFSNIDDFCSWIFNKSKHTGYTFIAHYGKGYDFQFIAEWLLAHGVKPSIIHNGQKIIQLEVKHSYNIRFIDSISFTLIPLKDFPKTFGLAELAKGYFPHKFNTDENQNYVGPYPDKYYYGYEELKKVDREKFDEWYETTQGKTFNFAEEMYKYCRSDVDILRRGCVKLRELFIQIANIDPFQYITIASVCQAIYRNDFLPKDTVGICDETQANTYSIKAIKWLKYIAHKENINIRHACNGGEQGIVVSGKTYKVDGYCSETNTIYQFHGCYWHGCSTCYDELTVNRFNQYNMKYLNKRTMAIDKLLRNNGYNLVTIWEHEFDRNKEMKNIKLDEYDLIEPPRIRDGFFGGRCEPVKLIYDFRSKDVKGKYIDVVSLYPTVMYYDRYPVGHPKKIYKPEEYDKNWFGVIYCKVLPPRRLYLPVLPYKQKTKQSTKLLFGLCRTCMDRIDAKCKHFNTTKGNIKCNEECTTKGCQQCKTTRKITKQNCQQCYSERNADCTHSDLQRAITGLWTTTEIEKALIKGYEIVKIYEVLHFEQSTSDLWKGYIRKFLKIKLETSKFTCSEEEYRKKASMFGIELEELNENPGLRFIAKICLNSLWGKFGQNPKVKHSEYIDKLTDFYRVILNDKIDQISLSFLNDNMIYANYEVKDEFVKSNYNTNIYIACFTSSWARLRLYDMLEKLDKNVCYCDTDSIVYIENEQTKLIVAQYIGDGLGQWSDELEGCHMDFWCSAQAKDYGYILNNGKHAGKVKGFRVNAETEEQMTNEQRVKLIKGIINHVDVNYNRFDISNCEIITKHMVKQWAFKFDKRMIRKIEDNEIDTLPYGY